MIDRLRWMWIVAVVTAVTTMILGPGLASAQGIGGLDTEHMPTRYSVRDALGGASTQGGVATPHGLNASPVTGMPPPQTDPAIEYANGMTDFEFGCYMQAREDFRRVLSVQPKNTRALFLMGVAYNSTGDRAAAASAYQKALKINPGMIDAQRELAVSFVLLGQSDKAQVLLDGLKARAAACGEGCTDGELLTTSVERVQAALAGKLTEAMNPAPPAVCSALTTTAARNCFGAAKFGDPHGDGVAACSTALASGLPDTVKVRVLIDRGVVRLFHTQAKQAIEDFDNAIAMNGQIGDAYTNRGAAHLSLKQFELAKADIDKGLAIGSGEPQRVYYNRGMANEYLGDNKAAYLDFLKASQLDPSWPAPLAELSHLSVAMR